MTDASWRRQELTKLPKAQLARMHDANGGCMGLATYMQWRKDELVTAVLEDEGYNPWSA